MQISPTIKEQIDASLDQLSERDQARVLAFAHALISGPQGIPTQEFFDFFRQFTFSKEEKGDMQRIIEEIERQ